MKSFNTGFAQKIAALSRRPARAACGILLGSALAAQAQAENIIFEENFEAYPNNADITSMGGWQQNQSFYEPLFVGPGNGLANSQVADGRIKPPGSWIGIVEHDVNIPLTAPFTLSFRGYSYSGSDGGGQTHTAALGLENATHRHYWGATLVPTNPGDVACHGGWQFVIDGIENHLDCFNGEGARDNAVILEIAYDPQALTVVGRVRDADDGQLLFESAEPVALTADDLDFARVWIQADYRRRDRGQRGGEFDDIRITSETEVEASAYYRFEEGTADIAATTAIIDSSDAQNHATPLGGPVYRGDVPSATVPQTGAPNNLSMSLAGSAQEIVVPAPLQLNTSGDATLEFYIHYPGNAHQAIIWGRADDTDINRFHVYATGNGRLGLDYREPTGPVSCGVCKEFHSLLGFDVPTNQWAHVALVRSGNTYFAYVNGVLTNTRIDVDPVLPTTSSWTISGRGSYSFAGRIDELRTVARALAPAEFLNAPFSDNQPPVANAGADETVVAGVTARLNGTLSSDPDNNNPLTYAWQSFSRPAGSVTTLDDPTSATPTFVPDVTGNYVWQLTVTDALGSSSIPDLVTLSSTNSAPIADAGPDQSISVIGTVVTLDGGGSIDPDGHSLSYEWSIRSPGVSPTILDDPFAEMPMFVAGANREYEFGLVVTDELGQQSEEDRVLISFENLAPVADAGPDQTLIIGATASLNGANSSDANGDLLSHLWSIVSSPDNSLAEIAEPTMPLTSITPDLLGTYVVSLVVNDGQVDSEADTLSIEVINASDGISDLIAVLIAEVQALDSSVFGRPNQQNRIQNRLNGIMRATSRSRWPAAQRRTERVRMRLDGCIDANGSADANDWIIDCSTQLEVRSDLDAIAVLIEQQL